MQTGDIHIRDPFVLPVPERGCYYLYGTTGKNCWDGPGGGFDCYHGGDLENWEGPLPAFRPPAGFWGTTNFWAPEVHLFQGRCCMLASFKTPGRFRGTQILCAPRPEGPFAPISAGPVTPANWECLDGTLHVDADGRPWIVFSHEWTQVHDGAICAMRLANDLTRAAGRPLFLFNASEAPWAVALQGEPSGFPRYVTDGPFLHRTANGELLMLWSSIGAAGYAMGVARSTSGTVAGPWEQEPQPVWGQDGGHGMIFRSLAGRLFMALHRPNDTPNERPLFVPIEETGGRLTLTASAG